MLLSKLRTRHDLFVFSSLSLSLLLSILPCLEAGWVTSTRRRHSSTTTLLSNGTTNARALVSCPSLILGANARPKKSELDAKMPSQKRQASLTGFYSASNKNRNMTSKGALSSAANERGEENRPFMIYCDLDGVLVDFDAGVEKLFKGNKRFKNTSDIPTGLLWSSISRAGNFYTNLPWTNDGKELWRAILPLKPNILTGVPMNKEARAQKAAWCSRELPLGSQIIQTNHVDMAGPKKSHQLMNGARRKNLKSNSDAIQFVDIITCWTSGKHMECNLKKEFSLSETKFVLIDDREKLASAWEKAGGVFVHHTSTKETLSKLHNLGILSGSEGKEERNDVKRPRQTETPESSTMKSDGMRPNSNQKKTSSKEAAIDLRDSSDEDEVQIIE